MSTSARIGIELESGKVKCSFCNYDGYPSYMQPMLEENYSNREKLTKLIELGTLRMVGEKVAPPPWEIHKIRNGVEGVTQAYGRDGESEDHEPPVEFDSKEEFLLKDDFHQYSYLYTKEGKWIVVDMIEGFKTDSQISEEALIKEAMIEAGKMIAEDYVKKNVGRFVPLSFPNEHDHMISILASALQTKYGYGYEGGSLVKNLVENKLYETLSAADMVVQKHIVLLAAGVEHIRLKEIKDAAINIVKLNKKLNQK